MVNKYTGEDNIWDAFNKLDPNLEELKSALFNYYDTDSLEGFIDFLKVELDG